MARTVRFAFVSAAAVLGGGLVLAQDGPTPAERSHQAREAQMQLQAIFLGQVGPMAQGNVEYDAAAAQSAAENLHHLAQMLDSPVFWVPGSAQGEVEGSRALPVIWEDMEGLNAQIAAFQEAAAALEAAAGTDLAGLQGALGAVGQACGSCHEAYRADAE